MYARSVEQIRESGIEVLLKHEVLSVDFDNKTLGTLDYTSNTKTTMSYDRLMIATGASAIKPPISGIDGENVYTITKPYDGNRFKENLHLMQEIVIVGGGFIGVEMAEQLAHAGKKVHIIEAQDNLLSGS